MKASKPPVPEVAEPYIESVAITSTICDITDDRFMDALGSERGRPQLPVAELAIECDSQSERHGKPLLDRWASILKFGDPTGFEAQRARLRVLEREAVFPGGRRAEAFLNLVQSPGIGTGEHSIAFQALGRLYSAAGELERKYERTVPNLNNAAEAMWCMFNYNEDERFAQVVLLQYEAWAAAGVPAF